MTEWYPDRDYSGNEQPCSLKEGDRVRFKYTQGRNLSDTEFLDLLKVRRVAGLRWIPGHWCVYLDGERDMFHVDCLEKIGEGLVLRNPS